MRITLPIASFLALLTVAARGTFAADPIQIDGPEQSKIVKELPDGGLPPVVGVKNVQVFRASRDALDLADGKGWTYNHHMDMASWKGRLYVAWLDKADADKAKAAAAE